MSDYVLYHYGVPGMKWGVRRKRSSDAKAARKQAIKDSMAESRKSSSSSRLGSGRKAIKAARKAGDEAYKKAMYDNDTRAAYIAESKKNRSMRRKGAAAVIAAGAMNKLGNTLYREYKDKANPRVALALNGLGYGAKALKTIGEVSITAGTIRQYANWSSYVSNYYKNR